MTWAKFDDKRHGNQKLLAAGKGDALKGLAANGLDANGITYCAQQETDGYIDDTVLPLLAPALADKHRADLVTRLVTVGRWSRDEALGGYWVVGYLTYNPSHAELEKTRREGKKRAQRSRERNANQQRLFAGGSSDPSRPVPGEEKSSSSRQDGFGIPLDDDDIIHQACKLLADGDCRSLTADTGKRPRHLTGWMQTAVRNRLLQHESDARAFLAEHDDWGPDQLAAALINPPRPRLALVPDCDECGNTRWVPETEGSTRMVRCPCAAADEAAC